MNNYIIESDGNKGIRETYQFYKQKILEKGDTPLELAQFGKAFREYFEQELLRSEGKMEHVWMNIDFNVPLQKQMEAFDEK